MVGILECQMVHADKGALWGEGDLITVQRPLRLVRIVRLCLGFINYPIIMITRHASRHVFDIDKLPISWVGQKIIPVLKKQNC